MIRSKFAMGFLWTLIALVLHVLPGAVGPAHAQGTRKDDIVFNSRGIPLAGATVRVFAGAAQPFDGANDPVAGCGCQRNEFAGRAFERERMLVLAA